MKAWETPNSVIQRFENYEVLRRRCGENAPRRLAAIQERIAALIPQIHHIQETYKALCEAHGELVANGWLVGECAKCGQRRIEGHLWPEGKCLFGPMVWTEIGR